MNTESELLTTAYKLTAILVNRLGGETKITEKEVEQAYLNMTVEDNWKLHIVKTEGNDVIIRLEKK